MARDPVHPRSAFEEHDTFAHFGVQSLETATSSFATAPSNLNGDSPPSTEILFGILSRDEVLEVMNRPGPKTLSNGPVSLGGKSMANGLLLSPASIKDVRRKHTFVPA